MSAHAARRIRPWLTALGWRIVSAGWKAGPSDRHDGPVIVSFTDFSFARWRDLPGAWLAGIRLRRAWPQLHGAIGLMLWAKPLARRSGSISAWETEADLRRFVRWPVHTVVMRTYGPRMSGTSTTWRSVHFVRAEAINEARRRLNAHPAPDARTTG